MVIMGIDPGYQRVGWAVIKNNKGINEVKDFGCLETSKLDSPENRLLKIYKKISGLFKKYSPETLAVEELFFATNAKTAIGVGQARGAILVAAALKKIPVVSYTPLVVKQTISGSGTADKMQIQKMVMRLLKLTELPKPDDAADALAIALTHAYSYKVRNKINTKKQQYDWRFTR